MGRFSEIMATKIYCTLFFPPFFHSTTWTEEAGMEFLFYLHHLHRHSTPLQHGLEFFATLLIYLGIKHRAVQHNRNYSRHDVSSPESNLSLCHESLPWIPLFLPIVGLYCNSLLGPEQECLYWFWKLLKCLKIGTSLCSCTRDPKRCI